MKDVATTGRTVILVSHNMGTIGQLCNQALVLSKGQVVSTGTPSSCVSAYLNAAKMDSNSILSHLSIIKDRITISSIWVNKSDRDRVIINNGDRNLNLKITGFLSEATNIDVELILSDVYGNKLAFFSPGHETGHSPRTPAGNFSIEKNIKLPNRMNKGEYNCTLSLTHFNVEVWVDIPSAFTLEVMGNLMANGGVLEYQQGAGMVLLSDSMSHTEY